MKTKQGNATRILIGDIIIDGNGTLLVFSAVERLEG
jgi:hypothetical protein